MKQSLITSPRRRSVGEQAFRGFYAIVAVVAVALILSVFLLGIGLVQGYRPVVLTSGSMTPTAPIGSAVIARPVDDVKIGDILVMSNEARATVTHRVVDIEVAEDGTPYAVTRGDANSDVDAEPFPLDGPQLVGRWILPGVGSALLWLGSPMIGLVVIGGAVLVLTMTALSAIWGLDGEASDEEVATSGTSGDGDRRETSGLTTASAGQKRFALAIALSMLFGFTGVAWSLYLSADTITGNAFGTSSCFDARLAQVQSGQVASSTDGITSVTIGAVDPAASFVTYSVRSNDSRPGNTVVLAQLVDATTVEFLRQTDTAAPPDIVIEWSVVEYACGVTVQRGTAPGNGTAEVDIPITSVDPESSFVLGGAIGAGYDLGFEADDVAVVELVGGDVVRFRTMGAPLSPDRRLAYQVVEFDSAGDIDTQVVGGTMADGVAVATYGLAQPVAQDATMVLASFATTGAGSDIGERMLRVRLLDDSTIEVQRSVTSASVAVNVQVVQFLDGTTVQHGVVDLTPSSSTASVPIRPVDLSRSTVGSTVLVGGASSGGSTDHVASAVTGEALVAARFIDPTTIEIERNATASTSSFAWQVVTWGGPAWASPDSPYRQRVDIDAGSVDVPTEYTTSLTFDHGAMVASGLSSGTGDDLRLWRFDGSVWTELDRVLDENSSWNDASTTLWFRTQDPIAAATTVTYWLYFGDQTPPPPLDDPNKVWLVDEGFESGLGAFEDRTDGTAWYRAEPWTRQIELTVDAGAVASTLTDGHVLVRVANPDLAANAQTDGSDFFFTDAGGVRLPHDVERWDPGTGTLTAWVAVDTLDAAVDTTLFLYYGAPDAPSQADPRGTWASDVAVWNMSSDPTGPAPSLDDRGPQNHDGVALADTQRSPVDIGWAATLDGATDRLEAAPFAIAENALTISTWFRADTLANDTVLMAQGDPAAGGVFELGIDATTTPGSPVARVVLALDGAPVTVSGGAVTSGTWHHVAAVWDQTTLTLVVDGVPVASGPAGGALSASRNLAVVLGGDPTGTATLDGDLGQARIRSDAVSVARLGFEESNLRAPGSVVVAGSPSAVAFRDQGDWLVRRPLTVSSDLADADVTDFVLLVEFVEPDLGAAAQPDGDDLVFTAGDGLTRLDHHLETWNATTGAVTAWVRLPLLSSSIDTEFFVYAGNPTAGDQSDPIGVWGPDADLVLTGP